MGIFSRFKDIVSANLNTMLDRAEDPEKMIRLMIREMEETLVELKAQCAGVMAQRKKTARALAEVEDRRALWETRAELAVDKGRDDLAREALMEKRRHTERAEALAEEMAGFDALVDQAQDDIRLLEEKLNAARERQRLLVERHRRAAHSKRARDEAYRAGGHQAMARFDSFEERIERMEAEADVAGMSIHPTLEEEFGRLEGEGDVEEELAALKRAASGKSGGAKAKETDAGPKG